MKKVSVLLVCVVLLSGFVFAQRVDIYGAGKQIDKIPREGMAISLELDKKHVEKMWDKKIKEFKGKRSHAGGATMLEGARIPAVSGAPVQVITKVESGKKGTEVWWAIDMGSSYVTETGSNAAWNNAAKIMKEFGLSAYRDDVNAQIAEAEKAHEKAIKAHEKEVAAGEQLVRDIEKNGKEKQRLEQELKDNADQLVQLKSDVENNKGDQETAKQDVTKMKQAVDVVRAKLDKIGR